MIMRKFATSCEKQLFALIRVDTHGSRFVVKEHIKKEEAKELERHYESMPHHQGYYVVPQDQVKEELERPLLGM